MNYVVLVKQVPDVKNIPPDAWDWEKGVLKRGMLDNVCNELDKQALAFAQALKKHKEGKIVALSMGPPFASEVLRYALSICADDAVLLTDKKLGGADTHATAYPLAQAIRKIEKDIFGGDRNYLVISGMQSVDGDTAQVPPQIAEELGIAHIAYVTSFNYDGDNLQLTRNIPNGQEVVTPKSFPALITTTSWTEPLFASFSRTDWAFDQQIIEWNADAIEADPSKLGLKGSYTTVYRIFLPEGGGTRNCEYETDVDKLAEKIKGLYEERLASSKSKGSEELPYKLPEDKTPSYSGEVWVYAEQEDGELHRASFELLGRATKIARALNEKVGAVLLGGDQSMAKELIAYGADKVYLAQHEMLRHFLPLPYTKTACELIEEYKPQMLLFPATPMGRELAPRIAYRSHSGLTADCTELDVADITRGKEEYVGALRQTRPALGGNIMASIISQNSSVQMSTARPGVMQPIEPDYKREGEIVNYEPKLSGDDAGITVVSYETGKRERQISDAGAIVSGGLGCGTKEGYDTYIKPLAEELGKFLGEEAMPGASRLAVERGFIDRGHQVGQTGQTVRPRVYVAVGISGAVQHLSGMQNSDIIVAINKDPQAPIFKVADLGVVGNLEETVPQLIEAMKKRGNGHE